jgi:ubiquitin-small subunit ribosomal protein S27Ae
MAKPTKKKKNKKKAHTLYEKKGNKIERINKFCPKCGEGYFLANHNNRRTCGKCKYAEFIKKEK